MVQYTAWGTLALAKYMLPLDYPPSTDRPHRDCLREAPTEPARFLSNISKGFDRKRLTRSSSLSSSSELSSSETLWPIRTPSVLKRRWYLVCGRGTSSSELVPDANVPSLASICLHALIIMTSLKPLGHVKEKIKTVHSTDAPIVPFHDLYPSPCPFLWPLFPCL